MFVDCRFERLCTLSPSSDVTCSLAASVSTDLTLRNRFSNVSAMLSNCGNSNGLLCWTTQQVQQTSTSNRGNLMLRQNYDVPFLLLLSLDKLHKGKQHDGSVSHLIITKCNFHVKIKVKVTVNNFESSFF